MSPPVKVTDSRHAVDARPGQQQQTVDAAHYALGTVSGCTAALVFSFVPKAGGGFRVEVGVAGSGPAGFPETVRGTLRAASDAVADAMARQEEGLS